MPGAAFTVTDMSGRQVAREGCYEKRLATTSPLEPGAYTAIATAVGFTRVARTVIVPASGSATLGVITLDRSKDLLLPAPGRWTIDPEVSSITVTASLLGTTSVSLRVNSFAGEIDIAEPVERSTVRARLRAGSVNMTAGKMQNDLLRAVDFLDVGAYPLITYAGAGLTPLGGQCWTVHGALTLHGVTRPAPLDLTYRGIVTDMLGNTRAAFLATFGLNRNLFGIEWNRPEAPGLTLIGQEFQIRLDIKAVRGDLPEELKAFTDPVDPEHGREK